MKYRSRTEIIAMILQSALKGVSKTKLMYSAFLSYAQLKEYLAFLESKEMIRFDNEKKVYIIGEKGLLFLNTYREVSDIVSLEEETPSTAVIEPARQ